ncbi:MAG: hypothetical protein GY793_04030 [Proteobacteria bacterium]|nr:hypothetical protein [Pseudomonadota bacterium]
MYTPQFRFALLISLFVIFGTIAQVLYTYGFGKGGLDIQLYLNGILTIASTTFGGFFFIWLCSKFITFNGSKTTGFEGKFSDEYGTKFVFKHPIKLSKYLPEIITKPDFKATTALESELIGFLYGYKNMPMDLNSPDSASLYDYSMALWKQSKKIKGANQLHHIVCLSKYLGLTYVHQPKRKSAPLWQFWIRDKITFSKRCLFHAGYSSFILSTMPEFTKQSEKTKKILLTAVRFLDNPSFIPSNSDPVVYNLYETAHKAEQQVKRSLNKKSTPTELNPSETDIMQFKQQSKDFIFSSIRILNLNPTSSINQSDGVYMGLGVVLLKVPNLLMAISKQLSPDIRGEFNLWDAPSVKHKAWKYIEEMLKENELFETSLEGQNIPEGINSFMIDDFTVNNSILIKIENKRSPELRQFLDSLPEFKSYAVIEKNEEDLIKEVTQKSAKIDQFIASLYTE